MFGKRGVGQSLVALALIVQFLCIVFFIWNFVISVFGLRTEALDWRIIESIEISAAFGLIIGGVVSIVFMRSAMKQVHSAKESLRLASGAFEEVVDRRLHEWSLSAAERDVAWFSIKGFNTNEIAEFRGSSTGTIKVQLASIYKKTGVKSRAEFVSTLIDDLVVDAKPELIKIGETI